MTDPVTDLGAHDPPKDPNAEVAAARAALAEVEKILERKAAATSNKEIGDILSAQALIAADPLLAEKVEAAVGAGLPAPHAITEAFGSFKSMLLELGGYLAERAADLDDIRARVVSVLLGLTMPGMPESSEPFVLFARDLAPADTAELDPALVLAFVTLEGGPTSHTAIIARSLGIPAVVSCRRAADVTEEEMVVVDGDRGVVITLPDEALLREVEERRERRARLQRSATGPGRTSDGHAVALLANIGKANEAGSASGDCEGVGLLRTEFLFLDRSEEPTLEVQEAIYRSVFDFFEGRKVVVRTLDAGADKPLAWLDLGTEANPALGVRGMRVARRRPDVLVNQLEALSRATKDAAADVWVMAPMVSTAAEAAEFVGLAHQHGLSRAGVMVEVPSLAICAHEVARVVDFFSIGTNDLCQYTHAADRMLGELSGLVDHWQPALIRLVKGIVDGAQSSNTPVGVCGESASDPLFALVLAGLGVSSLSMSPRALGLVRAALRAHSIDECRGLAKLTFRYGDPRRIRDSVAEAAHLP